jgi:hypothetical protein
LNRRVAQEAAAAVASTALGVGAVEDDGGGEDGGGGGGEGVGIEDGGLQGATAVRASGLPGRRGNISRGVLQLFKKTAELNVELAKLQVPGGSKRQLMLVEVDDQAPANTRGGKTAATMLRRDQRLLRVAAADSRAPKYFGELLRNAFSDQPAKQAFADCEVQKMFNCDDVMNMIRVENVKRARAPVANHAQTMADIIVNNDLPMSGQP